MTDILKSFEFGENNDVKLDIRYDDFPWHPWHHMDMSGQLDSWGERAGFVPFLRDKILGRGNSDAKGFTCEEGVREWLDDLESQGKWGVAFGIYCYGDCNNTMRLLTDIDWSDACCDGVIYTDFDMFRKWVGDKHEGMTDDDRIAHAKYLLKCEYKLLDQYMSGDVYYGVLFRRCDHCQSWVDKDSICGFYGCSDEVELAGIILDHFDLTPEERQSFNNKFAAETVV